MDVYENVEGMMKNMTYWKMFLCVFVFGFGSIAVAVTVTLDLESRASQDIVCYGPAFTYQHNFRQYGDDPHLGVSGDAEFVEEDTTGAYASYYTETNKLGDLAVFQYDFVAEQGALLDDVSIASRAYVHMDAGTVTGRYSVDGGPWIQFLYLDTYSDDIRPVDEFENVHGNRFTIQYTVDWNYGNWENLVQLFRSSNSITGQPGDYAFTFTASLITNVDCDKADIAGDDSFIDLADFAAMAFDYGLTESGLVGDIDGSGSCDLADLQWLAEKWLCDCYNTP